jgi:hypothetical protein
VLGHPARRQPLEAAEAVASLAAAQDDAVAWLDGQLRLAQKPDAARVQKLFDQLNDDNADKRYAASRELRQLGTQIEDDVKKMLAGRPSVDAKRRLEDIVADIRSLSVRDADTVRLVGAVYVLERIGSVRATAQLKKLADGDPSARLTCEAKISLERLKGRKPPKP